MWRKNYLLLQFPVTIFLLAVFCGVVNASEKEQIISGAGPSTKIVSLFFKHFQSDPAAQGYHFEVPSISTKHAGGITASGTFLFGRTGRPLKETEKALNKDEIYLAKVPVGFVVGKGAGISKLTINDLENIFLGKSTHWKEFGGVDQEIVVLGRERTEAVFSALKQQYPMFAYSKFTKVFMKDHEVVRYMKTSQGKFAISFGARANFSREKDLTLIEVDGLSLGVNVGLVYDLKNVDHSVIKAAKSYAETDEWGDILLSAGYFPPDKL